MDILEKARELADLLRQDERCLRLTAAKARNDVDSDLQEKIGAFNLKRIALDNAMHADHIDPERVKTLEGEMQTAYNEAMNNASMLEYADAKQEVDGLLSHINAMINAAVAGEPEPVFDLSAGGCGGGGCAGCHGCARGTSEEDE